MYSDWYIVVASYIDRLLGNHSYLLLLFDLIGRIFGRVEDLKIYISPNWTRKPVKCVFYPFTAYTWNLIKDS